jgi:F-type H+-transporting ATPase subunit b
MPQISQIIETYASQVFWLLITFGLIYFGIAKMMLPKVEATIDGREKKIADDLAAAQKARDEAEGMNAGTGAEIAAARAEAQASAAAAKAKAAKDAEVRVAKADADVATKLAAAESDIAKATQKALANIESIASEAAMDIVAKVSGAKVTPAQAGSAVKAVLGNG